MTTPTAAPRRRRPSAGEAPLLSALPVAILLVYGALLALPPTRRAAVALVQENRPVELLTFALLLAGGVQGLRLARHLRRAGEERLVWLFYALFGAGLVVIAMEEVAWGQWFLGFGTPEGLQGLNRQGEVTLHNIGALQGRSELFRLVFGVGGLAGLWLSSRPRWNRIGVPPRLWPWFAAITAAALLDLHADLFAARGGAYDRGWRWTSEVVEMLIGGAALLYVELKARELGAAVGLLPRTRDAGIGLARS